MKKNFFRILSVAEVVSFGKAQRNRVVKSNHINDFVNVIKDSKTRIELGDGTYLVFGVIPVVVNPVTKHILEGQHRLAAFIKSYELGYIDDNARILVAYWEVQDEEAENLLTIDLNSKTKNWSPEDYMTCYAQYIDYYKDLKEFCDTHCLCNEEKKNKKTYKYRYAAAMITGKGEQTALKAGTFKFSKDDLNVADKIHNELYAIRKKLGVPLIGNDIEPMAVEWHKQRKLISVADIKNLQYIPKSIRETKFKSKTDWSDAFAKLKDVIQKKSIA